MCEMNRNNACTVLLPISVNQSASPSTDLSLRPSKPTLKIAGGSQDIIKKIVLFAIEYFNLRSTSKNLRYLLSSV